MAARIARIAELYPYYHPRSGHTSGRADGHRQATSGAKALIGVKGKTTGVGQDIINFLNVVAHHFSIGVSITSGYRDRDAQALAMFKNWLKLGRGSVYKPSTLPAVERKKLDEYYDVCFGTGQSADAVAAAKRSFLELAGKTVGTKSLHSKGRAVDVARGNLSRAAHAAILTKMQEVKEGKRTDICHFQSIQFIPPVSDDDPSVFGHHPSSQHARSHHHPGAHHPQSHNRAGPHAHSLHQTPIRPTLHHQVVLSRDDELACVC
jgi:hypothetical protein